MEAALWAEKLAPERETRLLCSDPLELERRECEERKAKRNYAVLASDFDSLKRELAQDLRQARQELARAHARLRRRGAPPSPEAFTRLRQLWEHAATQPQDRKWLLTTLLEEAVLRADWVAG